MFCVYFCYCPVALLVPPSSDFCFWDAVIGNSMGLCSHSCTLEKTSHASPAWLVSLDAELTPSSEVPGAYSSLSYGSHRCAPFSRAPSAFPVCVWREKGQNPACCVFFCLISVDCRSALITLSLTSEITDLFSSHRFFSSCRGSSGEQVYLPLQ